MFVRDVVQIESPFEVVAPRFLSDPAWLQPLVASAIGQDGARCRRGTARRRADSLVVPMRWTIGYEVAFPSLDGDLAITPAGPTRSRVSFEATYTLSREDAGVGLRIEKSVETVVRSFLVRLAVALQPADADPAIQ